MTRTRIALIVTAIVIRYRGLVLRLTGLAARHPKRTVKVARGGKYAVSVSREYRDNPEAQRYARRVRRGARRREAARTLTAAVALIGAVQPKPKKTHRTRKVLLGTAILGATGFAAYKMNQRDRSNVS
jgi:hypothetical protein